MQLPNCPTNGFIDLLIYCYVMGVRIDGPNDLATRRPWMLELVILLRNIKQGKTLFISNPNTVFVVASVRKPGRLLWPEDLEWSMTMFATIKAAPKQCCTQQILLEFPVIYAFEIKDMHACLRTFSLIWGSKFQYKETTLKLYYLKFQTKHKTFVRANQFFHSFHA